jgi:hypothetical protein
MTGTITSFIEELSRPGRGVDENDGHGQLETELPRSVPSSDTPGLFRDGFPYLSLDQEIVASNLWTDQFDEYIGGGVGIEVNEDISAFSPGKLFCGVDI